MSKRRITQKGKVTGGQNFNREALFHLLKNRTYLGEVVHKDISHPAKHPPIIDPETFDEVQTLLASQAMQRRERPIRAMTSVLKAKIFDADGQPVSPSFTHRGHRVHRYYVSAPLQQGRTIVDDGAIRRVPAQPIETLVLERLQAIARAPAAGWDRLGSRLRRLEVHATTVQLLVLPSEGSGELQAEVEMLSSRLAAHERVEIDAAEPTLIRIVLPVRLKLRSGRT